MNLRPRTLSSVKGTKSVSLFVHHISFLCEPQPWNKPIRHKLGKTALVLAAKPRGEWGGDFEIFLAAALPPKNLYFARAYNTAGYTGYHFKGKISEGPESIFGS